MWWTLAHTGAGRVLGAVVSVIAPATVLALYAAAGMLGTALLSLALWAPAVAASPLASRPYDLRHSALSTWLNAGSTPPPRWPSAPATAWRFC